MSEIRTTRVTRVCFLMFVVLLAAACEPGDPSSARNPVADDVLFVVLGKMSLFDQDSAGEISLRNHHFVAEIMPKPDRTIVSGSLASADGTAKIIEFQPEGNAFLAHGARVSNPAELHELHPDGDYLFTYRTQSGEMSNQPLTLVKRAAIDQMPAAARVIPMQNGRRVVGSVINAEEDLNLTWDPMQGNTRSASSELDDLIFVLAFDCFGNNVAHSGRPYQGGSYLTYEDSTFVVPASALQQGLRYTIIVEQATADVQTYQGVPGISTYATLTFLSFQSAGGATNGECPALDN